MTMMETREPSPLAGVRYSSPSLSVAELSTALTKMDSSALHTAIGHGGACRVQHGKVTIRDLAVAAVAFGFSALALFDSLDIL